MIKKFMFLIVFLCVLLQAYAQERTITGKVVDETGNSLPGATVSIKGTLKATATDIDGKYSIKVPASGGVLVFTYVGYETQEITIGASDVIDVNFALSVKSLDEIVVVGYGVQKKSLVTGSISKVDSKDLNAAPVQRIDQALQGKTTGVFMAQQSGSPGSPMSIKIRGNSSNRTNSPLFIVDGVKTSNIDYLPPSDIESMEVLKDAASCAIYGTEGGNGVIIITTKKGVKGKSDVNYTYNHGWQQIGHKVKVMNAKEFIDYYKQAYRWEHLKTAADSTKNLATYNDFETAYFKPKAGQDITSTNWQDQVYKTAPIDQHDIQFSGGNEKGTFLLSASYLNQDGIVGGSKSNYNRFTFIFNGDQKMKDWLIVGSNVSYSKSKRNVLNESSEFGGIVTNTIFYDPTAPVNYPDTSYLPSFIKGSDEDIRHMIKDENGKYYSISNITSGESANPLALIANTHNTQSIDKILGDVHADVNILKSLKYTTRLAMDYSLQFDDIFTPTYYYNGQNSQINDTFSRIRNNYVKYYKYSYENFLTFSKTFGDHDITALVGMSYENYGPRYIDVTGYLVPENDAKFAYLYNTSAFARYIPLVSGGLGTGSDPQLGQEAANIQLSYFGRVNYNYKEKWLLEGTLRRDGSSLFGPDVRYVTFPSFSIGYNISKEDFFKDNVSFINSAKLRFSWGQNGSDQALYSYAYTSLMSSTGYYYTDKSGASVPGWVPVNPGNASLKWETDQQMDGGLDLALMHNKITVTVDYYDRRSKDQLVPNSLIPFYLGYANLPYANMGELQNTGLELELGYRKSEGDFKYAVSFNITNTTNKVLSYGATGSKTRTLGSLDGVSGDYLTVYEEGQPSWHFYGYKAIGVFQNYQEIKDYNVGMVNGKPMMDASGNEIINPTDQQLADAGATRQMLQKTATPGDVKYADMNKDGSMTLNDKTNIGNPWPKWTYGLNLSCEYKGIDFNAFFNGVAGNKIYYAILRSDRPDFNKPEYYYTDAWNGPGTSNKYPRASIDVTSKNYYASNLNVFSGNYLRLKNITLGYTLPNDLTKKIGISKIRIYASAVNLLTITNYPGADPEIGQDINYQTNNQSYGVDRGLYPSSKTYNVGVNVTF